MKMSNIKEKIANFPQNPGVYFFYGVKKEILYIGKATNLRSRVSSYFQSRDERGARIASMVAQVKDIKIQETDSVLEALILESNLIKKFQPKYNVERKDDKSFSYVIITKEKFPRVLILRETEIQENPKSKISNSKKIPNPKSQIKKNILNTGYQIQYTKIYGPYTSKKQLEIALKIIRKIFPYHSNKQKTEKGCLDFQLGRCPGPYAGAITQTDYAKNIRGIRMILEGKKKNLIKSLEREMKDQANHRQYEQAADIRNKIFALKHIQDIALISGDDNFQFSIFPAAAGPRQGGGNFQSNSNFQNSNLKINSKFEIRNLPAGRQGSKLRVEAYDISNISGQYAVGSMVVFSNGEPDKSQYRKFKIKTVEGSNDVGMMAEILFRRFRHSEWPKPDLILLDGGKGHLNMAGKVLKELNLEVPLVAVAKGPSRKNVKILGYAKSGKDRQMTNDKQATNYQLKTKNIRKLPETNSEIERLLKNKNLIKNIMDEAHRFAISYHKKLRKKHFIQA